MPFSMNKVILIGHLGRDCETRSTTEGSSVSNFSLATSRNFKNKDGNWVPETTWHNIVAWNLSDFYKDALKKGKKVCIEGRIANRSYMTKENVKRDVTEIISENVIILEAKGGSSQHDEPNYYSTPSESSAPADSGTSENDLPF